MTYDTTADRLGPHGRAHGEDWTGWATRPGFNPGKLLAVIAGFAIFPPLGLLALGYFIWNSRRAWRGEHGGKRGWGGCGMRRRGFTGNRAFDEHRAKVLDELDAEREAFFAYRAEARMKKDREEFEAFRKAAETKSDE